MGVCKGKRSRGGALHCCEEQAEPDEDEEGHIATAGRLERCGTRDGPATADEKRGGKQREK